MFGCTLEGEDSGKKQLQLWMLKDSSSRKRTTVNSNMAVTASQTPSAVTWCLSVATVIDTPCDGCGKGEMHQLNPTGSTEVVPPRPVNTPSPFIKHLSKSM